MRYELFIGLRYLRAKRKEAFVSLITFFSIAGVAIGVMTLTIVLSVMTGLEEDLRDRILDFTSDVLVTTYGGMVEEHSQVADRLQAVPGVMRAMPFVIGQAMLSTERSAEGIVVKGVLPVPEGALGLPKHLGEGQDLEQLGRRYTVPLNDGRGATVELPGIIVGKELRHRLGAEVGEPLSLISLMGTPTAVGMVPRVKRFVVVGYFDSGMPEYDSGLAYIALADSQHFFGMKDGVTGFEVRVDDLYRARATAERISNALGVFYRVQDWMERNHSLFAALKLEKTVYFIVLLLIILVAAFNIVATLFMVVTEKRKDIAILKSMGATQAAIAQIFMSKGFVIGSVGTVFGNVGGFVACWVLKTYQIIPLDPHVFYTDKLPVKIYPEYFAAVTAASLLICFLATLYPARQAARLVPVDIIRYE